MVTRVEGNPLWKNKERKYKCGCKASEEILCPVHKEPLQEQVIYGNEKIGDLNEQDRYEKENLNEEG